MNPIRAVTALLVMVLILVSVTLAQHPARLGKSDQSSAQSLAQMDHQTIAVESPAIFEPASITIATLTVSPNLYQSGTASIARRARSPAYFDGLHNRDVNQRPEPGIILRA